MYDIIQVALMCHLQVVRMLPGLWLKVHWLAHSWAFFAAGGHHSLMKEENISHSDTYNS